MIRVILEIIGSIFLLLFGVLFLLYLPVSVSELATDAIFIGAGALIMRKAILDRRLEIAEKNSAEKMAKRNKRDDARKRRTPR